MKKICTTGILVETSYLFNSSTEELRITCNFNFKCFSAQLQPLPFGAEAGAFRAKSTVTCLKHQTQPWALQRALRQTAHRGTNLHFSTEVVELRPKPAAENADKRKEISLTAHSSDYHYN